MDGRRVAEAAGRHRCLFVGEQDRAVGDDRDAGGQTFADGRRLTGDREKAPFAEGAVESARGGESDELERALSEPWSDPRFVDRLWSFLWKAGHEQVSAGLERGRRDDGVTLGSRQPVANKAFVTEAAIGSPVRRHAGNHEIAGAIESDDEQPAASESEHPGRLLGGGVDPRHRAHPAAAKALQEPPLGGHAGDQERSPLAVRVAAHEHRSLGAACEQRPPVAGAGGIQGIDAFLPQRDPGDTPVPKRRVQVPGSARRARTRHARRQSADRQGDRGAQ